MDYTNVKEYFEKYVKGLLPFRDSKPYQAIVALLQKHYLNHSYVEIPASLKTYVEDQKISTDLYNNLLLGAGYPQTLLSNLRFTQKQTIIQSLMDYNNYVGTLKYVNKVCAAFKENFNVYELYADFKLIYDESGVLKRDWVMVPREIYQAKEKVLDNLDYDSIYNATPTYFISRQQLELLRYRQSLALPFKTNLLMLDLQSQQDENDLSQLTSATSFYYFKDYYFTLYLNENSYDITIADAYRLYYYVLYTYNNKVDSPSLSGSTQLTCYNISASTFPYTLDPDAENSINNVISAYNNLKMTRSSISEFYNKYITEPFTNSLLSAQYTIDDFRKRIMTALGNDIVNDIDSIVDSSDTKLYGTITALGLIEDSLRSYIYTSSNALLKEYEDSLFRMFSPLLTDPELSATYQVLMFFKPYHTQLIAIAKYSMTSNTPLNNAFIEDDVSFVVHDYPSSSTIVSDDCYFSISIETGYFEFSNTNHIYTDLAGASSFTIGDKIYARDISTNIFPTETAVTITNIYHGINDQYIIKLDSVFNGLTGIFPRAYKYYLSIPSAEIDLSSSGGYFSFTTVGNANEVNTTADGFFQFSVGDWIYSPVDTQDSAVEIISKDYNTYSFILRNDYSGTSGVWTKAIRWRPS